MLIRSQDRKMLINMDNVQAITLDGPNILEDVNHPTLSKTITAYMDDRAVYFIGTYSTEAKAMDVLDQIEDMYMESKSVCEVTYQMPEDTEDEE